MSLQILDYNVRSSFGSIEIGKKEGFENIGQVTTVYEQVKCVTIDSFNFQKVDLLKLDIEGMEEQALNGARETIARCKPFLFIEYIKSNRANLEKFFDEIGYNFDTRGESGDYFCSPK